MGAAHALPAVHETIRVKSAAWDDSGVLIYTTLNHIKYCLPNGDSGIIRTLDVPVYITKVFGSTIYCLDRDGKNRQIQARPSPDSLSFLIRPSPVSAQGCVYGCQTECLRVSGFFQCRRSYAEMQCMRCCPHFLTCS